LLLVGIIWDKHKKIVSIASFGNERGYFFVDVRFANKMMHPVFSGILGYNILGDVRFANKMIHPVFINILGYTRGWLCDHPVDPPQQGQALCKPIKNACANGNRAGAYDYTYCMSLTKSSGLRSAR